MAKSSLLIRAECAVSVTEMRNAYNNFVDVDDKD